jgi:hypothetical protein
MRCGSGDKAHEAAFLWKRRGRPPDRSARASPLQVAAGIPARGRRLSESEQPTASPQRSPNLANRSAGYFAGVTSLTGVFSPSFFSPCLLAAFRSRARSCTTWVTVQQRALLVMPVHSMELSRRGLGLHDATEDELSVSTPYSSVLPQAPPCSWRRRLRSPRVASGRRCRLLSFYAGRDFN